VEKVATIHEDNLLSSGQNVLSPSRKVKATPIASLANLGNTCYLNSVLYTLRFSPNFMHNMHHMMEQLGHQTPHDDEIVTREQKIHSACERLHSLFTNLRSNEDVKNSRSQPVQPSVFLSSFRSAKIIISVCQKLRKCFNFCHAGIFNSYKLAVVTLES